MRNRALSRREFLKIVAAGGVGCLTSGHWPAFAQSVPYRVGVGRLDDPYAATMRAVGFSGEWPDVAGKTVIVKPNLVMSMPATSGATTDPQAVRALVDHALEQGAQAVKIIEDGPNGANFSGCGYDFFHSYSPKVALVDLKNEPTVLVPVPGGIAYAKMYMYELLLNEGAVFISAAKLKTHNITHASLSMKNLVGLAPVKHYSIPGAGWNLALQALHDRGINQAVYDLTILQPIDFAVIDGIWAMEGNGPVLGTPVYMGMVAAGRNPVAVDRVCLQSIGIPQDAVKHITYASRNGMGPSHVSDVSVAGDELPLFSFTKPPGLPPVLEYPKLEPKVFKPSAGQELTIVYWSFPASYWRKIEILQTSETSPEVTHIRTLRDWGMRPAGSESIIWDGRDDAGALVPPGIYCVRVQAKYSGQGYHKGFASSWVAVI